MLIGLLVGAAALGGGFFGARKFTRERLRFIDAIRHPAAPVVAGITPAAIAWPVAILPLITGWTAAAVGLGVAAADAGGRAKPPPPPSPPTTSSPALPAAPRPPATTPNSSP